MRNTLGWVDIPVLDFDRAIRFYAATLAATIEKQSFPGMEFALLPHADDNASGCLVQTEDNQPSATGPMIYLSVEGRLDEALVAVAAHGGTVLVPRHPIGPNGHRAIILDTEGNRIALHSDAA
jgi:uncharacterized protein